MVEIGRGGGGGGGGGVTSIKKTGESEITGDVTVSQGSNITITQSGQDLTFAASAGGSGEPHQAEEYLVFKENTTWKARNGDDGNIDYSNALAEEVLQDVMGALSGAYPHLVVIRGNV